MNKFADPEEEDFLQVRDVIEGIVDLAPGLIQRLSHQVFLKADSPFLVLPTLTESHKQETAGREFDLASRAKQDSDKEGARIHKTPACQWNIPRSSSGSFVGRTGALEDIQNNLSRHDVEIQKRYVITGIGGMGKSEICLRVIDKMREQYMTSESLTRSFCLHFLGST